MASARTRTWLPLVLLLGIIAFGAYIRLANLGVLEFNNDELDHYFAAQSLNAGRGPEMPSGNEYRRGIDLTRLVSVSVRYFEDPEFASRLPSAVFGVLNLVLFAVVAWVIGGPWAAVVATLLLAIYPEAVTQSRQTRFYTYQLNFGLVALLAGWHLVRDAGSSVAPSRERMRAQWLVALAAGAAFTMALRIQVTTLSVVSGFAAAIAGAGILDLRARGRQAIRTSVPLLVAGAGFLAGLLVLLVSPGLVRTLIETAQHVPIWAGGEAGDPLNYYRSLNEVFPALVALAPAIFLLVALRRPLLGGYLFLWFAVPVGLHSLLLAWKGERFIIMAVPALLLAAALVLGWAGAALLQRTRSVLERGGLSPGAAGGLGKVAVAGIALFALAATPAFHQARKAPRGAVTVQQPDWTSVGRLIREVAAGDSIPLGASETMSALFYWGRADFSVNREPGDRMPAPGPGPLRDFYSGAPVLMTPEAIRERFGASPYVLIGVDHRWDFGMVDPGLRETLQREAQELCQGRCGPMRLYRWPLGVNPQP